MPTLVDVTDLITQTDAGKLRGVSRPAIYSLVQRGRLRSVEICGTVYVFRSEVERLKTNSKVRTDDELLREVLRVKKLVGHLPNSLEYKKHGRIHLSSLCRRFGGWPKVIEAARAKI